LCGVGGARFVLAQAVISPGFGAMSWQLFEKKFFQIEKKGREREQMGSNAQKLLNVVGFVMSSKAFFFRASCV
jgi:hypothetical protein